MPSCHCGCVVRGQKSGIFTHLFQDVLRLHMFFDHFVFGVSHTATSTSVHYSFPTLLFPGVWGSCCFVLPRWSVEEFHMSSIFLCYRMIESFSVAMCSASTGMRAVCVLRPWTSAPACPAPLTRDWGRTEVKHPCTRNELEFCIQIYKREKCPQSPKNSLCCHTAACWCVGFMIVLLEVKRNETKAKRGRK